MKRVLLVALLVAVPVAASDWQKEKVEVDGSTYTVRRRGVEPTAMVYSRSPHVMSAAFYMKAKRAAEIATKCAVTDSFSRGSMLNVALDCSTAPKVD